MKNKPGPLMEAINLTSEEACILLSVLRPRAELLNELLLVQIQTLEPGDSAWADTQHELRAVTDAINKVHNSLGAA